MLATVSRRASLACQPQLRTKRVDLFDSGVRALARGGGYAGDCFASCLLVRQPRPRTKRVGFWHYRARASAQRGYEAGDRLASSSTSLVILSSERSTWASIAIVWHKEGACRRLFRVELTSLVILGSVRSTWASVITVRELRHGEVEALATVLRRAHLARQSRLSTKHVGFRHYCARSPDTGRWRRWRPFRVELSALVSFSSKLSSDRSTWASITSVCELWREEANAPATASRRAPFASQPQPRMKRVGFRYCARALAQGCGSVGG